MKPHSREYCTYLWTLPNFRMRAAGGKLGSCLIVYQALSIGSTLSNLSFHKSIFPKHGPGECFGKSSKGDAVLGLGQLASSNSTGYTPSCNVPHT